MQKVSFFPPYKIRENFVKYFVKYCWWAAATFFFCLFFLTVKGSLISQGHMQISVYSNSSVLVRI